MIGHIQKCFLISVARLALGLVTAGAQVYAQVNVTVGDLGLQDVPNMGQQITPLAPLGSQFVPLNPGLADKPDWLAGFAVSTVVSPDRKTLLILTSGYNRIFNSNIVPPGPPSASYNQADSEEYVFIYDISTPTPLQKQVLRFPVTYHGIVFDPSGAAFYVSGCSQDNVHVITRSTAGIWAEQTGSALAMSHRVGVGLSLAPNGATAINNQIGVFPCAAGLAIASDGRTLVVTNYYNDSITVFRGGLGNWDQGAELDLRPGKTNAALAGVPGGEYPFWVVVKAFGSSATAYVSSIRDREIDVIQLGGALEVTARIKVTGQPNKMTLNAAQTLLYVAEDQSDTVDVIDTTQNRVLEAIPVVSSMVSPALANYKGANPNSVALSPDETQLYVTNGNLNCIAVIALGGTNRNDHVVGLIPTGWYPNSVSFSGDGSTVYVVNGKSPTGQNADWCYGGYGPVGSKTCGLANSYNPQLTKAGFQTFPRPNATQLTTLTAQVALNDRFANTESVADAAVMAAVHKGIQHVIFIIKENRTYDQILGDLAIGDGQPDLAVFGENVTPNQHNLARTFVTLDNFLDTAEVSYDGWLWTTSAQAPDVVQKQVPVTYAYRALSLDSDTNRNVNVAIPTLAGRQAADPFTPNDPDVLPGQTMITAPDGPNSELNTGYLWNFALRAGLTVRNYGFMIDITRYFTVDYQIPALRNPASTNTIVAYPSNAALTPYTDPFFRGFDPTFPDYYRYTEWQREFDANYATGGLPSLSLVRLGHDHTGNFDTAIDGVNTPDLQVADNDYAVGLLIQKISKSIYANNTLIFVVEDDAQDGGDHVDSHRSIAFVAGAYVKQGALVHTRYTTLDYLRTIEEVLGLPPMNLNDALAKPMADIFNTTPSSWSFKAAPAAMLYAPNTQLPLPPKAAGLIVPKPAHNARYWARATRGMDFDDADRVDSKDFNSILWKGMMGNKPYPAGPTGIDLSHNRDEFLSRYRASVKHK